MQEDSRVFHLAATYQCRNHPRQIPLVVMHYVITIGMHRVLGTQHGSSTAVALRTM